jgi:MraZ protein
VERSGKKWYRDMFKGRSRHTLDEKGRLAVPARFKEALHQKGNHVLVLTNHDSCLWAFALDDWRAIEEKAANLSLFNHAANRYLRYFISGAQECPLKQGRITIPPDLRDIAGLTKECVLVGELKIFEIWDRERWEDEFEKARQSFAQDSQVLSELGI